MKDGESTLHLFAFMFRNINKIKQINKRNAKDVHAWFHPNKNTAKRVYISRSVLYPLQKYVLFSQNFLKLNALLTSAGCLAA